MFIPFQSCLDYHSFLFGFYLTAIFVEKISIFVQVNVKDVYS
jgi:hypothetical protein